MQSINRGLSPKLAALPALTPPRLFQAWAQPVYDRIDRAARTPIGCFRLAPTLPEDRR